MDMDYAQDVTRDRAPGDLGARMETDFTRLITSNRVPTAEERVSIQTRLEFLQGRLQSLSADLPAASTTVSAQPRAVQESMEALRSVISVTRRLPDDILCEIFRATVPPDPHMSTKEAPLLLGRICSGWRRLAYMTTPDLWKNVHVVVPDKAHLNRLCDAVDDWLSRSGALGLCVSLAVSDACEPDSDNIATVIDVLTRFSTRWRRVKLTLSPHTTLTPLTNLRPQDVPRLESISLTSIGVGTWRNSDAPLDVPWRKLPFLRTYALRKVSLVNLGGKFLTLPVIWPLLSSLTLLGGGLKDSTIYQFTMQSALLLLRECTRLVQLKLCVTSDQQVVAMPEADESSKNHLSTLVTMPLLTHLSVENREYALPNALHFFRSLVLPSLRSFAYEGPKYEYEYSTSAHRAILPFSPLLGQSALERLTMDIPGVTRAAFIHCMELVPKLKALRIEPGPGYDPWSPVGIATLQPTMSAEDLVQLLTTSNHLLANLRSLEIHRTSQLTDQAILDLLLSHGRSLRRLDVSLTRAREFDILPLVDHLVARGLDLRLRYLQSK
ncbi:unnamed protein product [Mycena citricolor]|uniref:F-box domain-containing protein n=1 Tax=Mycena citricolor TaxID=2018698 RepID=A0AAD2GWX8_9AGAR|nr:unnamed protein product [Mycena citricolor]CAK5281086.1 unnamed protein product [Mycena citricolor]